MPIYEYQCDGCGKVFEVLQKFSDPAPETHECGSTALHRIMSRTAFVLKGEGWYLTDYARKDEAKKNADKNGQGKSTETTASEQKSTESSGQTQESAPPTVASTKSSSTTSATSASAAR